MGQYFLTVDEVASDMQISIPNARDYIRAVNNDQKLRNRVVVEGHINRKLYEKLKENGFEYLCMDADIPLQDRLCWTVEEFAQMCGRPIGRDRALQLLKEAGLLSRNGKKQFVFRAAAQKWIEDNLIIDF